jgi:biopolymer transport protein ExbD
MHLNQVAIPDRDMPDRLNEALESKKEKIVYLKADQDASYGRVMAAFDALRKANVENIGLIADPKAQQGAPTGGGK